MSTIRPKTRGYTSIKHNTNPYDDSDDEDDFSQDNFSQSRSSLPSRSSLSLSTRRRMSNVLNQRDALMLAQMQLEEEKRRGKTMLFACIFLTCMCMILFKDRWPQDFRGALINLLDDGSHQAAASSAASDSVQSSTMNNVDTNNYDHSGSVDEFINKHSSSSSGTPPSSSSSAAVQAPNSYGYTKPNSNTITNANSNGANNEYTIIKNNGESNNTTIGAGTNSTDSNSSEPPQGQISRPPPELVVNVPSANEIQQNKDDARMEAFQQHLDNLSKYLKWNLPYKHERDVPMFWVVPLSGTALIDQVFGKCYGLVQAGDRKDLISGHEDEKILNVVTEADGTKYVNVNLGDLNGIKRAQDLRLTNAGVADVIRSSYLYESALLFQSSARYGKCFTMIRNPIERAVDVFRKLKQTSSNPVFASMTLEEYVKGPFCEDNWMVRFLTNEMEEQVEQIHLDLAKHVLGRKCFIGISEEFNESLRRFAKYFAWDKRSSNEAVSECMRQLEITKHVAEGEFSLDVMAPKVPIHEYEEGTEVHRILSEKNGMDLELYEYAKQLYQRQSLYSRKLRGG